MSDEAVLRFACFGGSCGVLVSGDGPGGDAAGAVRRAQALMLAWHDQFTRFDDDSELCRLNLDPRETVPVSAVMRRLVRAARSAARLTGGLVDATLLGELQAAGYRRSRGQLGGIGDPSTTIHLHEALAAAPDRRPATPRADARWREVSVDEQAGTVTRPVGLTLDLGGIAKGALGDILADWLAGHDSFAVDACGDVRFGGRNTLPRTIAVATPAGPVVHRFELQEGAAATSGIARRAWSDRDGRPAHHLLDPGSGRPAFTGLVQVTALAPTGLGAELRAKAALLSGPHRAGEWLADGGVTIADDGTVTVFAPSRRLRETTALVVSA